VGLVLFVCFFFSDEYCFLGPIAEGVPVFEDLYRDFIILHDVRFIRKRLEGAHAGGLIVGAVGIVDLEIEDIICDQGKEEAVEVEACAAEHSSGLDGAYGVELVDDVGHVFIANRHYVLSEPFVLIPAA